jgi:hypothetical protein
VAGPTIARVRSRVGVPRQSVMDAAATASAQMRRSLAAVDLARLRPHPARRSLHSQQPYRGDRLGGSRWTQVRVRPRQGRRLTCKSQAVGAKMPPTAPLLHGRRGPSPLRRCANDPRGAVTPALAQIFIAQRRPRQRPRNTPMSSPLLVRWWRAGVDRRQGMPRWRGSLTLGPVGPTLGLRGARAGLGSEEGLGKE